MRNVILQVGPRTTTRSCLPIGFSRLGPVDPRVGVATAVGDRYRVLTDKQWELLELLLPKSDGRVGRNFSNNRLVVEGMLFRLRTGVPWRDLPEAFGPWQTVWKRHRRYAGDGTWDRVLVALTALADATGNLDWVVSVDSSIMRVHQHGANVSRGGEASTGPDGEL